MRFLLVLALVTAGCASKKSVKHPDSVENKQKDLDQDKSERNADSPDDKDERDPKRGGDPCDGGE